MLILVDALADVVLALIQVALFGLGQMAGSLSPKETANLEKREASVQKQEANDMAKHNGLAEPQVCCGFFPFSLAAQ